MKYLNYFILASSLLFFSCNDWLQVKPQAEKDANEMFEKASGFKDALIGCYIAMNDRSLYGEELLVSFVELLAQHWDYNTNNTTYDAIKDFQYEKNTDVETKIKNIYGALYNVIVQANSILINIQKKGDVIEENSTRAIIEGEAYAIRAFCHLDILRLFGQMPLHPSKEVMLPYSEEVSNNVVPYYSYKDFTAKLEHDLKQAENLLKNNDPIFTYSFTQLTGSNTVDDDFLQYRQFRFNYYAVKALQARFYLYTGNSTEAYQAAQTVIHAKNSDGTDLLSLAGEHDLTTGYYSLPSECIITLSNSELSDYMNDLLDPNNGFYLQKDKFQNDLFAGQPTSNNRYNFVWDPLAMNYSREITPTFKKYYQQENSSSTTLALYKQIIPLIRLSEMYLISMETSPTLSEANTLYIEYMKARNVLITNGFNNKNDLEKEIINEYRREFWGEGQMFYTYKRLGIKNMLWRDDEVTENQYIIPLPSTEYNPNI